MRRIGGLDLLRPLGALTLTRPRAHLASGDAAPAAARHGLATAAAALASGSSAWQATALTGRSATRPSASSSASPSGRSRRSSTSVPTCSLASSSPAPLPGTWPACSTRCSRGRGDSAVAGRPRRRRGAGPAQGDVRGAAGSRRLHPDPRRHRVQLGARGAPVLPAGGSGRAAFRDRGHPQAATGPHGQGRAPPAAPGTITGPPRARRRPTCGPRGAPAAGAQAESGATTTRSPRAWTGSARCTRPAGSPRSGRPSSAAVPWASSIRSPVTGCSTCTGHRNWPGCSASTTSRPP